jgi:hypothetical protein
VVLYRVARQFVGNEPPDQLALRPIPLLRECVKVSDFLLIELGADVVHAVPGSLGDLYRKAATD